MGLPDREFYIFSESFSIVTLFTRMNMGKDES
jgi:hypothetical protein